MKSTLRTICGYDTSAPGQSLDAVNENSCSGIDHCAMDELARSRKMNEQIFRRFIVDLDPESEVARVRSMSRDVVPANR